MNKTFTQFKQDFYSRVQDFSLFEAGDMNLLKVVLDGLKVDYVSKGKVNVFIFKSPAAINFFFFLHRAASLFFKSRRPIRRNVFAELRKISGRPFLIVDPGGRTVRDNGKDISFYFGNILKALGRENIISVAEGRKKKLPDNDAHVLEYNAMLAASCGSLEKEDKLKLGMIRSVYRKIEQSGIFSENEKENIRIALQQFFIQYIFWRNLLSAVHPRLTWLWPHYHREGCIAACREKKIRVIELQHGLIADQDIFYVLPPDARKVEKKALFADEIWVYGKYWKDQLLKGAGYSEDRIKICGYYPFTVESSGKTISELKNIFPGKKNILVTTQTYMDEYFCRYIAFLSADLLKRDLPFGILVKLHPAESIEKYKSVSGLANVRVIEENLEALFRASVMHVTSFSTTIFDALRFDLPNFSIWVEQYGDYIHEIGEEGVSTIIQPDQNPVDLFRSFPEPKNKEYYYEEFNPEMFRQFLSV